MPVFQFWCFQVIIEWEISFSKALYIPIPHPVRMYLNLLEKMLFEIGTVHNAQEGYKKDFLNFGLACSIQSFELSLRW